MRVILLPLLLLLIAKYYDLLHSVGALLLHSSGTLLLRHLPGLGGTLLKHNIGMKTVKPNISGKYYMYRPPILYDPLR